MMCGEWGLKLTSIASKEVPVSALILTQSFMSQKILTKLHALITSSPEHREVSCTQKLNKQTYGFQFYT